MMRHETEPLAGNGRATIEVQAFDMLLVEFAEKVGAGDDRARPARRVRFRI